MVEYVYALHDFVPEHEDEVEFHAGERIEVVEKDDLYGDGWWQGRSLSGRVGLFPKSYTQPAPPSSPTTPFGPSLETSTIIPPSPMAVSLQPLPEEPEPLPVNGDGTPNRAASIKDPNENGEVMRATMTDVQKAIEQLGHDDFDGTRSIAFSSIREGDSTDHETEPDTDAEGDNYYKDARQKLAEKAKKQVEEEKAREAAESQRLMRSLAPPIEVELSDESEGEEEDEEVLQRQRRHSHILEEEEEDVTMLHSPVDPLQDGHRRLETFPAVVPSEHFIVPYHQLKEDSELPTATQATFPTIDTSSHSPRITERPSSAALPSPVSPTSNRPASLPSSAVDGTGSRPSSALQLIFPEKAPSRTTITNPASTAQDMVGALPSPAASSAGHAHGQQQHIESALSPASARTSAAHPSDWSVEEVVEWLKSKGFDEGICEKFIEQEITGDVLLELDVDLLKTEIGILAFGKRKRIANAITELRRPPSVISSEHNPSHLYSQSRPVSQSLAPSSVHQSLNSPHMFAPSLSPVSAAGPNPPGSAGLSSVMSPESPPRTGDLAGTPAELKIRRDSDPGVMLDRDTDDSKATIGLGIHGVPDSLAPTSARGGTKSRPAQLTLSPSDGALSASVKAISGTPEEADDERAVLSESETAKDLEARTKRKRVFGRSESTSSKDKGSPGRQSKDASTPLSSTRSDDTGSKHSSRKRSIDAAVKGADRLSIFGGAFSGTLGKSRKPPPRYSAMVDNADLSSDKGSRTFSRLYPGHGHRKTSGRPSTSDGTKPSEEDKRKRESRDSRESKESKEKALRDPAVLRKRTSSAVELPPRGMSTLKAGQSILEQIGTPDHNGWMRKKGDRYNTWKSRYFVLKGPHLYWLRSNSTAETKIKGYMNIVGYKLITDEKVDPGRYGFKMIHGSDKPHYFSSSEQTVIREWMKALMKATIGRDYTKPVVSSVNIPTIPLTVAQAMNPAPRPPSPSARAATQKALRRENPDQLSTRDAQILMIGLPSSDNPANVKDRGERARLDSFFTNDTISSAGTPIAATAPKLAAFASAKMPVPARPSREMRRVLSTPSDTPADPSLIEWANSHLPKSLQIVDTTGSICDGLTLLRLAESIKGRPCSPPVLDSAFPSGPNDDKLDGLFRLFDFLLDNDVKMGSVSINDVRQGKRDKIMQLLKALKAWEDKRRAIAQSIGKGSMQAGPFMAPVSWAT